MKRHMSLKVEIAGVSRAATRHMGIGIVLSGTGFDAPVTLSDVAGWGTAMEATYIALIRALHGILEFRACHGHRIAVTVASDVESLVMEMRDAWDVHDEKLQSLHATAARLRDEFGVCRIEQVSRAEIRQARSLARQALVPERQAEQVVLFGHPARNGTW